MAEEATKDRATPAFFAAHVASNQPASKSVIISLMPEESAGRSDGAGG